ncbi:MAG TPA: flagellar motor switch protein FliM [Rhodobiaceae bacterium]|nr:flagellar motor switch protein FliM [Rhodobiaceae bacterium]
MSSRKLSSDEVNALIEGLNSDVKPQSSADLSDSETVRPFTLGSDDLSVLGDYYALRMINERFARNSRSIFLPMLRLQPRISSFPPEVKTFDEYCSGLDGFMSLTTMRMEELRGTLMIVLDPNFISTMTNSYYGGPATPPDSTRAEFTDTESRLIELVSSGLGSVLQIAWRDLMPVTLSELGREVNPQFASFVDGSDLVIVCSFVVQLPTLDPVNFDIIYPLQTLRPIASQLRSRTQTDSSEEDLGWRERLERAVLNVPLGLEARLAEPTVSMTQLIFMKPGDVIPIQLYEAVELNLEGEPFYLGEMGEVAGQSAINLMKRAEPKSD